jgi:hypothetical protein
MNASKPAQPSGASEQYAQWAVHTEASELNEKMLNSSVRDIPITYDNNTHITRHETRTLFTDAYEFIATEGDTNIFDDVPEITYIDLVYGIQMISHENGSK